MPSPDKRVVPLGHNAGGALDPADADEFGRSRPRATRENDREHVRAPVEDRDLIVTDNPTGAPTRLERRAARERAARLEAERLAESAIRTLYERSLHVEAVREIAETANASTSFDEAAPECLRLAGEHLRALATHALRVDRESQRLVTSGHWWSRPGIDISELLQLSQGLSFGRGDALPGIAWEHQAPFFLDAAEIHSLTEDTDFSDRAREHFPRLVAIDRMSAGIAVFPVLMATEVIAVFEILVGPNSASRDSIVTLGRDIGAQFGRVVERELARNKLVTAHDELEARVGERTEALRAEMETVTRLHAELESMAFSDPLTRLANRTRFLRALDQACADPRRLERLAVIMLDLDNFKVINDSLGHAAGDELLIAIGRRLDTHTREDDLVARLGGDEFVVLCLDTASDEDALTTAARIAALSQRPYVVAEQHLRMSMSIGIARGRAGVTATELLREADTAAYHAKEQGRDRYELFDDELRRRARVRLETEAGLHRALREDRIVPHLQPIVDLATATVVGFEALARWIEPDHVIMPGDFIPIAEASGLIHAIGQRMLDLATAATVDALASGPPGSTLTVNVSGRQLVMPAFPHTIADIVDGSGIDPQSLCLEITETVLMSDIDAAIAQLGRLRDLGVKLAIDDFGTG